jgi:hypothetical protein
MGVRTAYACLWVACIQAGFRAANAAEDKAPTYHRDVSPVLQRHCQDCHRPGQIGPFALLTYDQARKRAGDLATVVDRRAMPPWPASTSHGGPFRDARVLSDAEIALLVDWVAAGAPEGDPTDAPQAREFASDWPLGPPDLILKPEGEFDVPATGRDLFRVFVMPTGLTEGRWVRAVDFRPGNPRVVHHILGAFDTTGRALRKDEADPEPGYAVFGGFGITPSGGLEGWAPGKSAHTYSPGVGRYLPAGSDILIQIHYHPSGKAERDRTAVGLYFADSTIDKLVRPFVVRPPRQALQLRPNLQIPAGEANYEVTGTFRVPYNAHVIAVLPHMHWLGRDFRLTATRPGETESVTLIEIDHWNFNWQGIYDFVEPVALPAGTVLNMVGHFDNSDANPSNPSHPPREVRWGEQTTDEMCLGFLQVTRDDEHLGNRPPRALRLREVTADSGAGEP